MAKKKARVSEERLMSSSLNRKCLERVRSRHQGDHRGQLAEAIKAKGITELRMAERMKTSRRQLDRLLDPATPSVTLDTLRRAANAVGRTLRVS